LACNFHKPTILNPNFQNSIFSPQTLPLFAKVTSPLILTWSTHTWTPNLKGLIVFFTHVIYVISGFHPWKNFGLISILVKKKSGKPPSPIRLCIFADVVHCVARWLYNIFIFLQVHVAFVPIFFLKKWIYIDLKNSEN